MTGAPAGGLAAGLHQRWPNQQIMALPGPRVLYLPIAKCACTSLKALMVAISGHPRREVLLAGDVHRGLDAGGTGLLLMDLDSRAVRRVLAAPGWFRFAVVRDPHDRLLSAYVDKFVRARSRPGVRHTVVPTLAAALGRTPEAADVARGISFRRFVETVIAMDPMARDPHWRPQALHFRDVGIDRLYGMGDMDLLAADLAAHFGAPVPLDHRNRSRRTSATPYPGAADAAPAEIEAEAASVARASFYDPALRAAVASAYAEDLALSRRVARHAERRRADPGLGPGAGMGPRPDPERRSLAKRFSLNGLRRLAGRPPSPPRPR